MKTYEHKLSSEIKTEILEIIGAFRLGILVSLDEFLEPSDVKGYIRTTFTTTTGTYQHYYVH